MLAGLWLIAVAGRAMGQPAADPSPPAASGSSPAAAPCCTIPARTEIELQLTEPVSSKTQRPGDTFGFRLAQPILVDGQVVIPAGAVGRGEVIDAAPPGFGGRAGKLVLAARYLMSGDTRLPLQSFNIGTGSGKSYANTALIVGEAVGVAGLLVTGGNIVYPADAPATAKLAAAVTISPPVPPATALAPAPTDPATPGGPSTTLNKEAQP